MDKLLKVVRSALSYLPAELWTKRWAKTGLDTNQGREEAAAFLKKLIDAGKAEGRVPKKWAEDEWFAQSGPMAGGSQSVD